MITVLLADDHTHVLDSLRSLLESAGDIQIVATAVDGVESVIQSFVSCADVVILDVSMPYMDGIQVIRKIGARCPSARVMMLSMHDYPGYIQRALEAGAVGYVLKDDIHQDLIGAVRSVHQGDHYFSERIAPIAQLYIHPKGNAGKKT